jgi:hypothetical protein
MRATPNMRVGFKVICLCAMICTAAVVGVYGSLWYLQMDTGFEEGSIGQINVKNRRLSLIAVLNRIIAGWGKRNEKERQISIDQANEFMIKTKNHDQDMFVAIIDKVDFARRTGIGVWSWGRP